jgi:hypothetical protein
MSSIKNPSISGIPSLSTHLLYELLLSPIGLVEILGSSILSSSKSNRTVSGPLQRDRLIYILSLWERIEVRAASEVQLATLT